MNPRNPLAAVAAAIAQSNQAALPEPEPIPWHAQDPYKGRSRGAPTDGRTWKQRKAKRERRKRSR